jgi:hypothetical protein
MQDSPDERCSRRLNDKLAIRTRVVCDFGPIRVRTYGVVGLYGVSLKMTDYLG